jgi:glucoamylase
MRHASPGLPFAVLVGSRLATAAAPDPPESDLHRRAIAAFTRKGDGILARLKLHTPADGQLYEQFDKRTGRPASSRGVGWSHAAFLHAVFERTRVAPRDP